MALRTGAQRMRPVVLTAVTTILGLSPMVLGLTIDFMARDIYFGAPATQYWVALSTAIVGGLLIATPLTLLFTPAMLAWMDRRGERRNKKARPAAKNGDDSGNSGGSGETNPA